MAQVSQAQQRARAAAQTQELAEMPADLISYLMQYARANPSAAALWCFGIGFVLGWKLKPW